ncbi:MAG: TIGR03032 family protein [Candidatus Thiodiazotropha sp. (ex Dulcina madagascariensis)]|nr:TIGR03032 family protein [Candidatus Thiodiazotropha sp. (ex Dulcina madagascariensis)]MCU7928779.1 TIGR03032 family protein [Candidatus Thiodiazotropha sp. (ex Dulcina madagascariensis)]
MQFKASFSSGLPRLLDELNISLILTTYQAGKVILISSDGEAITQLLRNFDRPMGVALQGDMLALALRLSVAIFRNDGGLAESYPKKPHTYDALYFPIALNKTDFIDTHDLFFTRHGLVAVNTAYSCLVKIDAGFSFQPVWRPAFISELDASDRCHLNGMAVDDTGEIRYVTAFGTTDSAEGWRTNKLQGGVVIDVHSNEVVAEGIGMPHSPRLYRGRLYLLSSATEALLEVDTASGRVETLATVNGFIRGLSFKGDYAFIGTSKLRKSHTFGDLSIANKKIRAGVTVINLKTRKKAGEIIYEDDLQEIYDVHVLDGKRRPNILNLPMSDQYRAMLTPQGAQWIVPENKSSGRVKAQQGVLS